MLPDGLILVVAGAIKTAKFSFLSLLPQIK